MFGKRSRELPVPPAVKSDPNAVELVRVWAAHGQQHVSISPEVWEDPAAWGIMLVDLARHVANHYHQEKGRDPADVLSRIRLLFDAEWESPTSEATGGVVQ
jgi:hypothetical protein